MNKGFSLIFFVLFTSAMLLTGIVSSFEWRALVRERVVAHVHRFEVSAAARSCQGRALMWSENILSYTAGATYTVDDFSCLVISYSNSNNTKNVSVEIKGEPISF